MDSQKRRIAILALIAVALTVGALYVGGHAVVDSPARTIPPASELESCGSLSATMTAGGSFSVDVSCPGGP